MDVYVIPVGREHYELYCEPSAEAEAISDADATPGYFARLRGQFTDMLHATEERQRRHREGHSPEPRSVVGRMQDVTFGWVAQRIAEQRLLWNLRRHTAAVAVYPQDMSFEQVMALIRRTLQRDWERHRRWMVIDTLGLIVSIPITIVPGPNVFWWYFAFRVVGHWLSLRGATQGLRNVSWTGRACPPLAELRDAMTLESSAREARLHDIAEELRLPHLTTFFERVAVRHA
jgi:hypothetical protein